MAAPPKKQTPNFKGKTNILERVKATNPSLWKRVDPCNILFSPTCQTPPYQSCAAKFMKTQAVTAVSLTEDIWGSDVSPPDVWDESLHFQVLVDTGQFIVNPVDTLKKK